MAVLNGHQIRQRMRLTDYDQKLVITPLLSEKQISAASVDVRLGSSIIIPQKTYVEKQDVTDSNMISAVSSNRVS